MKSLIVFLCGVFFGQCALADRALYTAELVEGAQLIGVWRSENLAKAAKSVQLGKPSMILKGDFKVLTGADEMSPRLKRSLKAIADGQPTILFIRVDRGRADIVGDSGQMAFSSIARKAVQSVIAQQEIQKRWSKLPIPEQLQRSDLVVRGIILDSEISPKRYVIEVAGTPRGGGAKRISVLPVSDTVLDEECLFLVQRYDGTGPNYMVMAAIPRKDAKAYLTELDVE